MKEKDLQEIGFEKELINEYEGDTSYYYSYRISKGMDFISSASDEIVDDDWFVEVFDTEEPIRFYEALDIKNLIEILQNAKANK